MYDDVTSALIRSTPRVDGFEPDRLPELLTQCYTKISTLRLQVTQGQETTDGELLETVSSLRTLATTLEIYAVLSPQAGDREAAAFVSASAHQLLGEARRLFGSDEEIAPSSLRANSVPSEVSAALLFLAAGYPSDASEVIRKMAPVDPSARHTQLLLSLVDLCEGHLNAILPRRLEITGLEEPDAAAEQLLWVRILDSLQFLARRFLGELPEDQAFEQYFAQLEIVRQLAVRPLPIPESVRSELQVEEEIISTYAGPHHLATLLIAAGRGLDGRGLIEAPRPTDPPSDDWSRYIRARVNTRPFLWTNHMEALHGGLLDRGVSAVITFPTGAGKSTLSELKIAATVLAGGKVIYLAPTLALVAQVGRNVKEMLSEANVQEDIWDDQFYALPEVALERAVSVMTPDRCLFLLTLYPDSFKDVSLIVFDECHFLHFSAESSNTRPVSAMLGFLQLFELAPEADILLMSAMVKNGKDLADWLEFARERRCMAFDAAWKPTRQARGSIVFSEDEINKVRSLIPAKGDIPQKSLRAQPSAFVCLQQKWTSTELVDYRRLPLISDRTPLKGQRRYFGVSLNLDTTACASSIANIAARKGLRVIVFFHNPSSIGTAMKFVSKGNTDESFKPTAYEGRLIQAASLELGGDDFVLLPNSIAGGHYGDLLLEEREIVEGAFARESGIKSCFRPIR